MWTDVKTKTLYITNNYTNNKMIKVIIMNLIKSYKREAHRDGAGDRTVRTIGGGEIGHDADDQRR